MRFHKRWISIPLIGVFLTAPSMAVNLSGYVDKDPGQMTVSFLAPVLIFLIPTLLFYKNIKWYFYLLLPLIAATPLFLFSIHYHGVAPGFELIAFLFQTNPREVEEAVGSLLIYFIPFELTFLAIYLYLVRLAPSEALSLKRAAAISVMAASTLLGLTYYGNGLHYKTPSRITKGDLFLKHEYPFSLVFGMREALTFLEKNNLDQAGDFTFHPVKKDPTSERQVLVLIIGESSRYDHWQVNGYARPTSPRLLSRADLLTFSDVVAGAHYTWASVPQLITRADPDNFDVQYREKSILTAFREAGFRTYWLSNQSDQDIFWSGVITLHAKTADFHSFSPTYSPNLEYERIYDGRLLPLLDSVLRHDQQDLFIVLHTMGNHWDYSQRYPPEFDVFTPSGYTEDINPPHVASREALLNSYDNSVLYADHIIDSVISLANSAGASAVMFVSDHGEDLFDANPESIDFHFRPSAATLRVPLFMWSSHSYRSMFPWKWEHLKGNVNRKVGTENIFHTLVDLGSIRMQAFDSTRSLAHPAFLPGQQKFYGDDRKARLFADLETGQGAHLVNNVGN